MIIKKKENNKTKKMIASVKYHWALNENGETVHIPDVNEENRRNNKYFCPSCNCSMIPAIGKIRQPYFRHQANGNHCSYESYLHELAKKRLKEEFNHRDNFLIEVDAINKCDKYGDCLLRKSKCDSNSLSSHEDIDLIDCLPEYKKILDLKQLYDVCEIEKGDQNFIADVKLSNSKDPNAVPFFFEVYVTHMCEQKKLDSGIPIIEFHIEREEDLSIFAMNIIQERKQEQISPRKKIDRIVFYNLNGYEDKFPYENDSRRYTIKTTEYFMDQEGRLKEREGKSICHHLYTGEAANSIALTGFVFTIQGLPTQEKDYAKRCWLVYSKQNPPCCEQCKYSKRVNSINGLKIICRKKIGQPTYQDVLSRNFKCESFELDEKLLKQEIEKRGCLGWVKKIE